MGKSTDKRKYQKKPGDHLAPKAVLQQQHAYTQKKHLILSFLLVFCIPVLLYVRTIKFGFTYFDDDGIILGNLKFLSNPGNILQSFFTDQFVDQESSFYRPLGTISYILDYWLSGGNNPWMYHLSQAILSGLIAGVFYLVLLRFSVPAKLAFAGSLFYYVHPLFVSTVAHLPNRAELLLSLFSLLSLLFLMEYLQRKRNLYLLFHLCAFAFALFSKETAAFLPFLFILYYFIFYFKKSTEGNNFRKSHVLILAGYGTLGILWYWMRSRAIVEWNNTNETFGFLPYLLNLRLIPESLAKFFIPSDIAPIPGFSVFNLITGIAIIVFLTIPFFKNNQHSKKEKLFCILWFFVLMAPSMLYKHPHFDYLDHRFFLPMTGILLFVMFVFPTGWIQGKNIRYSWLFIFVIIGLCVFSFLKSASYSDPITFFNAAIAQNPKSEIAYNNRGFILGQKGYYDKALDDLNKAIELNPEYAEAYNNRGNSYNAKGMADQAIQDYTRAVIINPHYAQAFNNRGLSYDKKGLFNKALSDFSSAAAINPSYAEAFYNSGLTYVHRGDNDSALLYFTKAIEVNPAYVNAYINRGVAYENQGMHDNAIAAYNDALKLQPQNADAYCNRAIAFFNRGSLSESIADFSKAIEIQPGNAQYYLYRGAVFAKKDNKDNACNDYDKASELGSAEAKQHIQIYCR